MQNTTETAIDVAHTAINVFDVGIHFSQIPPAKQRWVRVVTSIVEIIVTGISLFQHYKQKEQPTPSKTIVLCIGLLITLVKLACSVSELWFASKGQNEEVEQAKNIHLILSALHASIRGLSVVVNVKVAESAVSCALQQTSHTRDIICMPCS